MTINYATTLGDDVSRVIASFLTDEKILPKSGWRYHKDLHQLCLRRGRPWAEECDNKAGHPVTVRIYDAIMQSIDEIIAYITRPPIVFIKSDVTEELLRLYNGGWISDAQYFDVKARCGIEADRLCTVSSSSRAQQRRTKTKRKKKKLHLVDKRNKLEKEQMVEELQETSVQSSIKRMVTMIHNFGSTDLVLRGCYKKRGKWGKQLGLVDGKDDEACSGHCKNRRRKKITQDYQLKNYNKKKGKRNKRSQRKMEIENMRRRKSSMEGFVLMIALPMVLTWLLLPFFTASGKVVLSQHVQALLQSKKSPKKSPKKREFDLRWARATRVCGRRVRRKRRQHGRRKTYKEIAREAVVKAKNDHLASKVLKRAMEDMFIRLDHMQNDKSSAERETRSSGCGCGSACGDVCGNEDDHLELSAEGDVGDDCRKCFLL